MVIHILWKQKCGVKKHSMQAFPDASKPLCIWSGSSGCWNIIELHLRKIAREKWVDAINYLLDGISLSVLSLVDIQGWTNVKCFLRRCQLLTRLQMSINVCTINLVNFVPSFLECCTLLSSVFPTSLLSWYRSMEINIFYLQTLKNPRHVLKRFWLLEYKRMVLKFF